MMLARRLPLAPPGWQPCTRETRRCEFWTWGKDYLRPECCTRHLKDLLFFTEDLLSRHGITHWIDYGSLLGAVRQGTFIPWDSDVDFGILKSDRERLRALRGEIADAGYRLDTSAPHAWRIRCSVVNTQHVDLELWREEDGLLELPWPGTPDDHWAFPRSRVDRLEPVHLYGRAFPAPSRPAEFLARYRYGPDYRTPRRPVLSAIPSIPVRELTPVVGRLLEEIRERDWRLQQIGHGSAVEDTVRAFADRRRRIRQFEENLVRLHDVLESTPLAGRYWVIGGLLIGWAREGRVLPHDCRDADFAVLREDRERLLAAVVPLARAGFQPRHRYVSNAGVPVEYKFTKDGAGFDFFVHECAGDVFRYWYYWPGPQGTVEVVSEVPAHGLAPMPFLGRTWLKPEDHDAYLKAIYGAWTVPDPGFSHLDDDLSIVGTEGWTGSHDWPARDWAEGPS